MSERLVDEYLSARDAAKQIGVSHMHIYRMAKAQMIRRICGRNWSSGTEGEGRAMETTGDLLDIRGLAERWDVSIDTAKRHVRRKGVPFIRIGTDADMRINWNTVRFRLSAVARWEQESEEVFEPAVGETPAGVVPTAGQYKYIRT